MSSRAYGLLLLPGLWLIGLSTLNADAQTPSQLISVETGDLPIILTAPHGGSDAIPGVLLRQGNGVALFKSQSDAFTDQLTEKLADAIEAKQGQRPYLIIARFHRKYLDANRRARDAYESPEAEAVYNAYHQAIADARDEIIKRWGHGTLIDIHGQAAELKTIFRGTQNGKTTTHLVNRFGREALIGESSLFGLLAQQGLQVIPEIGSIETRGKRWIRRQLQ
jgi:N-formylglutamate amidohydrolase